MSASIEAVSGVGAAAPVSARQVRIDAARPAHGEGDHPTDDTREAVATALNSGGSKIAFGSHSAEFSYDEKVNRVVVRIYSSDTPPREVIRQFPPAEYLAFVTRFREMFGVLFDEKR